jgi:hypothetical protein
MAMPYFRFQPDVALNSEENLQQCCDLGDLPLNPSQRKTPLSDWKWTRIAQTPQSDRKFNH